MAMKDFMRTAALVIHKKEGENIMNDCKKNLIELFEFFDGYFDTDKRLWIIPYRYRKSIFKSMQVYGFRINVVNSIKDSLLCKIVNNDDKRTLQFVAFYKGKIRK